MAAESERKMPAFGVRLAELRGLMGLTQKQLAARLDRSLGTVRKLEQHQVDPRWSTVVQICRGLHITPMAFWGEE